MGYAGQPRIESRVRERREGGTKRAIDKPMGEERRGQRTSGRQGKQGTERLVSVRHAIPVPIDHPVRPVRKAAHDLLDTLDAIGREIPDAIHDAIHRVGRLSHEAVQQKGLKDDFAVLEVVRDDVDEVRAVHDALDQLAGLGLRRVQAGPLDAELERLVLLH